MVDLSGIIFIKKIYLVANGAEPAPPLGTILGNIGANASSFCTSFNNRTSELPSYFSLKVTIFVYTNKSTQFILDLPSTTYFLGLLKFDRTIKIRLTDRFHEKIISCVDLYSILQLAKLKFPNKPLHLAFKTILGSVYSMGLTIVKERDEN